MSDFSPVIYKYFQKSTFRYQLWPSFSQLIFNENGNLSSGQEYISNKRFYKHDHFLTL